MTFPQGQLLLMAIVGHLSGYLPAMELYSGFVRMKSASFSCVAA